MQRQTAGLIGPPWVHRPWLQLLSSTNPPPLSHTHTRTLDFTRPPFSWCFSLPLQRKREDERRIRRSRVTNTDLLGSPPLAPESGAGRWWRRPVKDQCKMYLRLRFDARELDQYVKKAQAGIKPGYFLKTSHGLLFECDEKHSCV